MKNADTNVRAAYASRGSRQRRQRCTDKGIVGTQHTITVLTQLKAKR